MLIEYIEPSKGEMLSVEWFTQQGDNSTRRKNFFRDYSRIMLSASRIPLPVIGSFIIDSNGFLIEKPPSYSGNPGLGERGDSD